MRVIAHDDDFQFALAGVRDQSPATINPARAFLLRD